jgi:hypothetical protein
MDVLVAKQRAYISFEPDPIMFHLDLLPVYAPAPPLLWAARDGDQPLRTLPRNQVRRPCLISVNKEARTTHR